jgi:hypothetical protein
MYKFANLRKLCKLQEKSYNVQEVTENGAKKREKTIYEIIPDILTSV